jgi:hypothetical protein
MTHIKEDVHDFWNTAACGEQGYALGPDEVDATLAKLLWPRRLFRRLTPFLGLYLLIEARKV